jgi:hypothetical protein
MLSDNLSPSEMLLLHELTKDWDRFSRQMKTEVIYRPTRLLSQKTKVFGLQRILVEIHSFRRLAVAELVLCASFL